MSPFLYSLLTHDCRPADSSNTIIKFADDTTVIGLIKDSDEAAYREEVDRLAEWCDTNNLLLNTGKTKELILQVPGSPHLSEDLTWTTGCSKLVKKAHQRLFFLRTLRKNHLSSDILVNFYRCTIESILTSCITVWYGSCSAADRKALQRVVKAAQRIAGAPLPSIEDIYRKRCLKRAGKIIKDSSHPAHRLFTLLPSGKRYRSARTKTTSYKRNVHNLYFKKPWVNGEVRAKLKARTEAYNSGDLEEYRKSRYALRRAISSSTKRQYRDKVESHYKGSNTRSMWAGLKTLTDYKKKISSAEVMSASLPDELNTFYARFESTSSSCGGAKGSGGPLPTCDNQGRRSVVPTCFKETIIVPVPKKTKILLGLIIGDDETAYYREVRALTSWCQDNNLHLNVSKTKELIVDFRRKQREEHAPLSINGTTVERVNSFRFHQGST
ncbi:hypothetical protein L3Q82_003444 [Scortum barcoo]|uniref:Uncharacterized protein n=1 Tax=Scortum barcoo TaxID=214431 RepID=A0ACB8VMR2_9TELE|nr:hypothetical protein L3Q82_003444 [Scortum barcoo]